MPYRHPNQMWTEAFALLADAERLQRQFFRPAPAAQTPTWEPPVDLLETRDAVLVTVALPGVAPERVEVHLNGGQLMVSGVRPLPRPAQAMRIHRLELPYGRFERRIPLPPGHYELLSHVLKHGCLQLNLRKL
jgi:HSP20 family protein